MRYIFDKDSGILLHKDDSETIELVEKLTTINNRIYDKPFCLIVDSIVDDATSHQDLLNKIEQLRIDSLNELNELDKEVPRLLEDLIEFTGYVPHPSKDAIINRKNELREILSIL